MGFKENCVLQAIEIFTQSVSTGPGPQRIPAIPLLQSSMSEVAAANSHMNTQCSRGTEIYCEYNCTSSTLICLLFLTGGQVVSCESLQNETYQRGLRSHWHTCLWPDRGELAACRTCDLLFLQRKQC